MAENGAAFKPVLLLTEEMEAYVREWLYPVGEKAFPSTPDSVAIPVLAALALQGHGYTIASRMARISVQALKHYRETDPDFAESCKVARRTAEMVVLNALYGAASNPNHKQFTSAARLWLQNRERVGPEVAVSVYNVEVPNDEARLGAVMSVLDEIRSNGHDHDDT